MSYDSNRRTVLKAIGAGTAALVGGAGVVSASPGGRGPPSKGDTIVDIAVNAEGFDVLVAAVKEADLVETLSGNRQLTVFAPTDGAFDNLGVTADNVGDIDFEKEVGATLPEILTYHVTPGRRNAKSVTTSDELPTLNGAKIDVGGPNGTVLNEGQATIIDTDIPASNGIIHVIDGVLLP